MDTHAVVLLGPGAPQALATALKRAPVTIRPLSASAAEAHMGEEPARKAATALAKHDGYDVACLPLENRRKKILLCDMDSTIVEEETLDEIADAFGFGEQVRAITELAMKGELNFEEALRRRVGLLHGTSVDEATEVVRERTNISKGAVVLVRTMRLLGAKTALVTGGFDIFAEMVGEAIGFDSVYANCLRSSEGVLTGEVASPILGQGAKRERLEILCRELDLTPDDVVAVGDGANDRDMIELAGMGVGYRPKPVLEKISDVNLRHHDLTAILALQGIPQTDWVTPQTVFL